MPTQPTPVQIPRARTTQCGDPRRPGFAELRSHRSSATKAPLSGRRARTRARLPSAGCSGCAPFSLSFPTQKVVESGEGGRFPDTLWAPKSARVPTAPKPRGVGGTSGLQPAVRVPAPGPRGAIRQAPPPAHEEVAAAKRGAHSRVGASTAQSPRPGRPEVRGRGEWGRGPREREGGEWGRPQVRGARGPGVGREWGPRGAGPSADTWGSPRPRADRARAPAPRRRPCSRLPALPGAGTARYLGRRGPKPGHLPQLRSLPGCSSRREMSWRPRLAPPRPPPLPRRLQSAGVGVPEVRAGQDLTSRSR